MTMPSEDPADWLADVAEEDVLNVGSKVIEMADRVKVMHSVVPGAEAKWFFEVDDLRFAVVVTVAPPSPETTQG